jgi:rhamnogalacturonan endolyase
MRLRIFTFALTALPFTVGRGSFLQQTSNDTWIIGNDIWNITQGPIYGTKLYYQGKDAIGKAAGHYVGAGINQMFFSLQNFQSDMLQMERTI